MSAEIDSIVLNRQPCDFIECLNMKTEQHKDVSISGLLELLEEENYPWL